MATMEKLYTLMDEYEKTFGTAFSLFVVSPDPDEAAQTAQRCLDENKTVEELLGITYDEKTLY